MFMKTPKYNINTLKSFCFGKKIHGARNTKVSCVLDFDTSESWWVADVPGASEHQHSVQLTEMKLALGVPHHVPQRHKARNCLDHLENVK